MFNVCKSRRMKTEVLLWMAMKTLVVQRCASNWIEDAANPAMLEL